MALSCSLGGRGLRVMGERDEGEGERGYRGAAVRCVYKEQRMKGTRFQ